MPPARVAPGPAHPEPRVFLAPRFRGAAARTSRVWLTELSLYPLSNAHLRWRLVARWCRRAGNRGEPTRLAHVAEHPPRLCPREGGCEAGGALVVPAAHLAAREGSALRAGSRRGRSRTPHVDRDDCDDYEYPHDGDANGGRWGGRVGDQEPLDEYHLDHGRRRTERSSSHVPTRTRTRTLRPVEAGV
ncbi:hypothetical protein B0H14DRAFT_2952506, partial [Mycena olivaceomarginata]